MRRRSQRCSQYLDGKVATLPRFVQEIAYWDVWRGLVSRGYFVKAASWAAHSNAPSRWRPNKRQWDNALSRAAKAKDVVGVSSLLNAAVHTFGAPRDGGGDVDADEPAHGSSASSSQVKPTVAYVPSSLVAAELVKVLASKGLSSESLHLAMQCRMRGNDPGATAWAAVAAAVTSTLGAATTTTADKNAVSAKDATGSAKKGARLRELAAGAQEALLALDDSYAHKDWYRLLWTAVRSVADRQKAV
eukprot:Opistho-2@23349